MSFNKCRLVILNYPISVPGPCQHLQFWSIYAGTAELTFTTRGQHGIESVEQLEAASCFMKPVGLESGVGGIWGRHGENLTKLTDKNVFSQFP